MRKFFNIAGPCIPEQHFMLPPADRCGDLNALVEEQQYFVIHAPRQVGKTTLIQSFVRDLNASGRYLALYCSLERAQGVTSLDKGIHFIVSMLQNTIALSSFFEDKSFGNIGVVPADLVLTLTLQHYCRHLEKPLVIMFDEVDCLSEEVLISFLRQLRDGYVNRGSMPFIHSLALVGMRNVRDFKVKVREGRQTLRGASPFNIVSKAFTIRNFTKEELSELLAQHTAQTGQAFPPGVVDKIFEWTRGQPWLCNAVAREITRELLAGDVSATILETHVNQAVERIILRRDTHIDYLAEQLKAAWVSRVVEAAMKGKRLGMDYLDEDTAYTFDLGLLDFADGNVKPANPIYAQVIRRYFPVNSEPLVGESVLGCP